MENKASIFSKQKSRGGERDEEKAYQIRGTSKKRYAPKHYNTLKRIEVILRDGQNSPAKILQDAIEASLSQPQEHSLVLPLTIPDLSQLLEQKDLQIK